MSEAIKNRYEFTVLFDVENGNPNGDPDAGNMPRIDPETGYGIVTDVCLKRKIRNYVEVAKEDVTGYRIYVKDGSILNLTDKEAFAYCGIEEKKIREAKEKDPQLESKILSFMCANFYDIRTFGAVMTSFTKKENGLRNCGQVRGPVQFGFAKSIDKIWPRMLTISRCAVAKEKDANESKENTFGNKSIVPYALYRVDGYVSANLARKVTGFSEDDLTLLWEAIINMFEHDHAAARGNMAVKKLIVFKHATELGNAPAYKLFDTIKVERKEGVEVARSFNDYIVEVAEDKIPEGVECIFKI